MHLKITFQTLNTIIKCSKRVEIANLQSSTWNFFEPHFYYQNNVLSTPLSDSDDIVAIWKSLAYTVQVEETQDPEHNGNNRRVNVRPSITVDDNTGNACNLPDNCMPENDIFDKNGDTNPRTDKDLLPTSLFLVFLITGTHICAFGIISYMAMLERTWSCLVYSVIYVLIGTIYLLLTFSHGTAEKNRLKLCAGGIVTKI